MERCKYTTSTLACPYGCVPPIIACHIYGRAQWCRYGSGCHKVHCEPGFNVHGAPIVNPHTTFGSGDGDDNPRRHHRRHDCASRAPPPRASNGAPPTGADPSEPGRFHKDDAAPPRPPPTRPTAAAPPITNGQRTAHLPSCAPNTMNCSQALFMLGLDSSPGAEYSLTPQQLKEAFRSAILTAHPDHAGDESTMRAAYLISAREILSACFDANGL